MTSANGCSRIWPATTATCGRCHAGIYAAYRESTHHRLLQEGDAVGRVCGGLRSFNQVRPGVFDGGYAFDGVPFGAYIVGIVENLFGGYVSIEFKSVVAFAIIVLVLCIKPSGLFARHYVKKV